MIRPVTCVCFLLACGSGLYLYQSKHRVQVLDREIEKTVHGTDALREQTRVLHAEWTLLNDPQRLQALADQFLSLKTVAPGQFTSMADLDSRLPAIRPPEPPPALVAQSLEPVPVEEPPPVAALPTPPKPVNVAATATPPRPSPERRPVPPRPVVAEVVSPRVVATPVPAAPRPIVAAELARPAPPRIVPVAMPASQAPTAFGGSALGMAHSASLPPPQPMPVSASQWVNNGGGGG